MNIEQLRNYCLTKKEVTEGFPFGDTVLVFKVCGKMFLLVPMDTHPLQFNAKCDPEYAEELRASYAGITPGYHMSKKHWNTVVVNEEISAKMICELIDHSYDEVVKSLPKKERSKVVKTEQREK